MKKVQFYKSFWLLLAIPLFLACDNEAPYYGEGLKSEFNKLYSSKANKDHVTADLALTYSGEALYGKDIYFNLMTENTAKIKFFAVFPGEAEVTIENVAVTQTAQGYTINGSGTTPKNTTFKYTGTVVQTEESNLPLMTLSLSDVAMPANALSQKGTLVVPEYSREDTSLPEYPGMNCVFYNMSLLYDWKFAYTYTYIDEEDGEEKTATMDQNILFDAESTDLTILLGPILSNLLYLLLTDLNFYPDGNITATYSPMPEEINVWGLLSGTTDSDREPKTVSPKNLITYHMDGEKLYIRPELETIINLIATNNASTRADDGGLLGGLLDGLGDMSLGEILALVNNILNAYNGLQQWVEEGICFNFVKNDPNEAYLDYLPIEDRNVYFFGGEYKLYIDQKELQPLLSILPLILNNLDISFDGGGMGIDLGPLLEMIAERTPLTTRLDLGLFLN